MVVVDEGEMKLWVDDMMDYGGDGEPVAPPYKYLCIYAHIYTYRR